MHIFFPVEKVEAGVVMRRFPGLQHLAGIVGGKVFAYEHLIGKVYLLHQDAVQSTGHIVFVVKNGDVDAQHASLSPFITLTRATVMPINTHSHLSRPLMERLHSR